MSDPFAEAAARAAENAAQPEGSLEVRHPRDATQMPVVVDPISGEVHADARDLESDRLAQLAYRLRQAEAERRLWRSAIEDELRSRLEREGRKEAIVGDYALAITSGKRREWDADELEGVVSDLVDSGVLAAGEIAELITREAKVNGTLARQLLERMTGAPHEVLASCFTWVQKGPRVTIEPVPEQLPPGAS
jgi:hypothetical protein